MRDRQLLSKRRTLQSAFILSVPSERWRPAQPSLRGPSTEEDDHQRQRERQREHTEEHRYEGGADSRSPLTGKDEDGDLRPYHRWDDDQSDRSSQRFAPLWLALVTSPRPGLSRSQAPPPRAITAPARVSQRPGPFDTV